jgi:hypothetical protein
MLWLLTAEGADPAAVQISPASKTPRVVPTKPWATRQPGEPSPARGSAGQRAGTERCGLQLPQCSGLRRREGGVLQVSCDLSNSRPEVPEGAEMELAEPGGESPRVAAPTPAPQVPAGPRPGIAGALPRLWGREDGRSNGSSGGGEGKVSVPRRDPGSGGRWVWGRLPELGRRVVGLGWRGRAGWVAALGGSRLPKGGV